MLHDFTAKLTNATQTHIATQVAAKQNSFDTYIQSLFFLFSYRSEKSIIEQIRFEDLDKFEELRRMIPRCWLRIEEEVHMSYVSVKGLSDSNAKNVMKCLAPNLLKSNLSLLKWS